MCMHTKTNKVELDQQLAVNKVQLNGIYNVKDDWLLVSTASQLLSAQKLWHNNNNLGFIYYISLSIYC